LRVQLVFYLLANFYLSFEADFHGNFYLMPGARMTKTQFTGMLESLADAWRQRDYKSAARWFADDVKYADPVRYSFRDRLQLQAFFEADEGYEQRTVWHTIIFDETQQAGAAEYTYNGTHRYHGTGTHQGERGQNHTLARVPTRGSTRMGGLCLRYGFLEMCPRMRLARQISRTGLVLAHYRIFENLFKDAGYGGEYGLAIPDRSVQV
jgi:hypothetical protein